MRLSFLFSFIVLVQLSATGYSQSISLDVNNMEIRQVIKTIEQQSDYRFFYTDGLVDLSRRVNMRLSDKGIDQVLSELFGDTGLSYRIVDGKLIMLAPKGALQQLTITGRVTDDTGEALPGASIVIKGTTLGTMTDAKGVYSLQAPNDKATLVFTYIGFATQEIVVGSQRTIDVVLLENVRQIDEVVVVGYGTQSKVTLTGSVSSIKSEELIVTKNENVQNMLTGKVLGVRVTQQTAEPGSFANGFDIRAMGTPLVVIDGIPRGMGDFQRLDPNDVDNISVLKDASAAIYGVRAANGVVLVTTKNGSKAEGKPKLNYSGSYTFQVPSGLPSTVNAMDYMTLRNELSMHNINGGTRIFQDALFEEYRNGERQSYDWYPLVFSNWSPQEQHNLSATGGNERTTYYLGIGYSYQEGFFKTGDLNYTKYNLRSNISAKITNRLTFSLNLSGILDEQQLPSQDTWWIIHAFWRQGSHQQPYADDEGTMPYHSLVDGFNPLPLIDADVSGYRRNNNRFFQSSASLKYEVPGVKGLDLKGTFSYDCTMRDNTGLRKEYRQYRYDAASEAYQEWTLRSPNHIERESFITTRKLAQLALNYANTFGAHKITGLLALETQKHDSDNFYARRDLAFPIEYILAGVTTNQEGFMYPGNLYINANNAFLGRVNYSFSDKYMAEFLFRHDGSSKFTTGKQWGFFPAASVGWRVSEEGFFKNLPLSFVDQLKFRVSYGKTGDDAASSYQFVSGYNYPTGGSSDRWFSAGYVFNGNFSASVDNRGIPNRLITWYTANTFNIGADWELWHGLFGGTFEYFSRKREGLLTTRNLTVPTVVGSSLPQENLNSDQTFGLEMELTHRNRIGQVRYNVKGLASITRVKMLYVERDPSNSSMNNWRSNNTNRLQGIEMGYGGAGRFTSWEDIWSSPVYISRGTLPGDYMYEDWNGDGQIDGNDVHPIRFNQSPWLNFGLITDVSWKGLDFNMLLQSAALSSQKFLEQLRQPLWGHNESSAMSQFMDRWHPVNPDADPYDPAAVWVSGRYAYTGTLPDEGSEFNVVNSAYLRLKSIELGYTLPAIKAIQSLRVFVNAYNLLTFTKVKAVDPEHPGNVASGYSYPLNKTVSVGLNLTF